MNLKQNLGIFLMVIAAIGFFTDYHCRKSWIICLDAQKLESSRGICPHCYISYVSICINRTSSSTCNSSSCMIVITFIISLSLKIQPVCYVYGLRTIVVRQIIALVLYIIHKIDLLFCICRFYRCWMTRILQWGKQQ